MVWIFMSQTLTEKIQSRSSNIRTLEKSSNTRFLLHSFCNCTLCELEAKGAWFSNGTFYYRTYYFFIPDYFKEYWAIVGTFVLSFFSFDVAIPVQNNPQVHKHSHKITKFTPEPAFFQSCCPTRDHVGRSTVISNPAWHLPQVAPRVDETTGSVHPQPTLPNC